MIIIFFSWMGIAPRIRRRTGTAREVHRGSIVHLATLGCEHVNHRMFWCSLYLPLYQEQTHVNSGLVRWLLNTRNYA